MKFPLLTLFGTALLGLVIFGFTTQQEQLQRLGSTTVAVFQGGTGQNSFTAGQLLYGNGATALSSVATTSVTCSGTASCSGFSVIGPSPITISGTGLSGYDAFTHGNYFGQPTSATTTALRLNGSPFSLFASSTALFSFASSTQMTVNTLFFRGNTPTLQVCGTATITSTSTDARGTISVSAGTPTTCNLKFSATRSDTPTCIASTNSLTLLSDVAQASTTGVQFGLSAVFSGNIYYVCLD